MATYSVQCKLSLIGAKKKKKYLEFPGNPGKETWSRDGQMQDHLPMQKRGTPCMVLYAQSGKNRLPDHFSLM